MCLPCFSLNDYIILSVIAFAQIEVQQYSTEQFYQSSKPAHSSTTLVRLEALATQLAKCI